MSPNYNDPVKVMRLIARTLVRFGRWLEPVLGGRSNETLRP